VAGSASAGSNSAAANPWVIHVARMRRHQSAESHEVRQGPVDEAGPLAEEGIDPGRSIVPEGAEAECDVTLRAFDGGIEARGSVRAPWVGVCRRCATAVGGELDIAVTERFAVDATAEDDFYPIADDAIDLGPLVRDAIVLELPMAPLCREDCRGLCPQCGADRNEGDCSCVAPKDPRWANLDVLR
jgi:uncharacterized protein